MREFLYRILLFFTLAIPFYVVFLLVIGSELIPQSLKPNLQLKQGSYGHFNTRLKEVKTRENIDILFLGSSHAYRGFDVRIFEEKGLDVFNLGSSSQTPLQTEVLLDRYLDRLNPKLIVYEVYPVTFQNDGVEAALDLISNDENDLNSFDMVMDVHNLKVYNTYMFKLFSEFLELEDEFNEPSINAEDKYIQGGYVEKEIKYFQAKKFTEITWQVNSNQEKAFDRIIQKFNDSGRNFLLVYAPITKDKYSSVLNGEWFDEYFDRFGTYYNFNEKENFVDTLHFYDYHHLNQKGVSLFNEMLIDTLRLNHIQEYFARLELEN